MQYQFGALGICAIAFAYVFLRRRRRLATIEDVPGPVNPSWIFGTSPVGQPDPSHFFSEIDGIECVNVQGHQWYIQAEEAGAADKRFLEYFGNIVYWNGPFGVRLALHPSIRRCLLFEHSTKMIGAHMQEDRLWIADPKAINHILQKSGYFYAKPTNIREQVALLADRNGIASVEGGFSPLQSTLSRS